MSNLQDSERSAIDVFEPLSVVSLHAEDLVQALVILLVCHRPTIKLVSSCDNEKQ